MTQSFENSEFMRYRFRSWFDRVGALGDWRDAYREIEDAYRTPPRSYHSFHGHVAFCIQELYTIPKGIVERIDEVELALTLHDSRMNFIGKDNESRSASFATDLCGRMGLSMPLTERVLRHIISTDHSGSPDDPDSRLVVDIDLAVLGQDEAAFNEYERAIREEYGFIPEDIYRKRRVEVLRRFLERPSVFLSGHFKERYEKPARTNLETSIERLSR
ncbi:MAG: hypothetical protein HGA33_06355 [Candidatus Moranbacteria bacterium]|nr:hypothetical protein [Candidatus Moranbacteria bacterium]